MEQNSQNSVKVTYEIVDPKVNETTIKIVNAYREEEKKSPIDNILPIYANPDDAGADIYATSCKWDEKMTVGYMVLISDLNLLKVGFLNFVRDLLIVRLNVI